MKAIFLTLFCVLGCRSTSPGAHSPAGPAPKENRELPGEPHVRPIEVVDTSISGTTDEILSTEGQLPKVEIEEEGGISGGGGIPRTCFLGQDSLVGRVYAAHGITIRFLAEGKIEFTEDDRVSTFNYKLDEYYSCDINISKTDDPEWKKTFGTTFDWSYVYDRADEARYYDLQSKSMLEN